MRHVRLAMLTLAALVIAGCAKHEERPASTLTEAQRDSAIARSQLPGADVVGKAMQASGREERRAEKMDSLAN
jgi:hypothetical protein